MIQITVTFLDRGDGTTSLEYKVNNPGATEAENGGALVLLGLMTSFFDDPDENGFLTPEQGEIVRKKIETIVNSFEK